MEKRRNAFGMLLTAVMGMTAALCLYSQNRIALPADSAAELPAESKYLAMTFDDGPRLGTTDRLLDGLKQRGASATFFVVGEQAALYPDLIKRMDTEGHQVGNHTWSHARLEGGDTPDILQEIQRNETLLSHILEGSGYWIRPPYGMVGMDVAETMQVPLIKWSVDPRDWESRNAEQIVKAVLRDIRPNSIVLLHDIHDPSVDAALELVDRLQEQGYLFVTVEELLRLNGIEPEAGMLYRSGEP